MPGAQSPNLWPEAEAAGTDLDCGGGYSYWSSQIVVFGDALPREEDRVLMGINHRLSVNDPNRDERQMLLDWPSRHLR
jgi:hypothetical protein